MEGFGPGLMGEMFGAMWASALPPDRTLQLVSTTDVCRFAAQAFFKQDQYKDRAISLAGDELIIPEASKIFEQRTGIPMSITYTFLETSSLRFVKEFGVMLSWFRNDGFGANIPELKERVLD